MKTNFVKGDCWQSVVSVVPPKLILRTRQLRELLLDVVNPQTGNELPEDYYVMGLEIRFLCQQDVSSLCWQTPSAFNDPAMKIYISSFYFFYILCANWRAFHSAEIFLETLSLQPRLLFESQIWINANEGEKQEIRPLAASHKYGRLRDPIVILGFTALMLCYLYVVYTAAAHWWWQVFRLIAVSSGQRRWWRLIVYHIE